MNVRKVIIGDAALVRRGAEVMGTQKALARVAGCSVRVLSEVANGKRALPTAPVPGPNKTPAELIRAAIAAGGKVAEVPRPRGRRPRLSTLSLTVALTAEEAEVVARDGLDLSAAVLSYIKAHRPRRRWKPVSAATPALPSSARRRLTPEALAAMNAYLGNDVSQRPAFLRAAVQHALAQVAPARAAA